MEINDLASKAIAKMNMKITDEIFLIIQEDRELMRDYLILVQEKDLCQVNKGIGKAVKSSYRLANCGRADNPRSTLIKSYQRLQTDKGDQ